MSLPSAIFDAELEVLMIIKFDIEIAIRNWLIHVVTTLNETFFCLVL